MKYLHILNMQHQKSGYFVNMVYKVANFVL
jgi:hypothetical protein